MEQLISLLTWIAGALDGLTQLIGSSPVAYLVVFALAAFDVVFPLLPSEAAVTAAAVVAGQGHLSIVAVIAAAGLGAFFGDNVAYWIGRAAGRPLVERVLRGNTAQLTAIQEQFDERGGTFIIVGRFVPGGRTAVAIGAGLLHFPWSRFVAYDLIAAIAWATQAALPGFIGGALIADKPWLALVIGFSLSAVLAVSIALIQRWRNALRALEAPVRPSVIGIGGTKSALETRKQAQAELEESHSDRH